MQSLVSTLDFGCKIGKKAWKGQGEKGGQWVGESKPGPSGRAKFSRCVSNCPILTWFLVEFLIHASLPRPGEGGHERSEGASHSQEALVTYPVRHTIEVQKLGTVLSHLTTWQNLLEWHWIFSSTSTAHRNNATSTEIWYTILSNNYMIASMENSAVHFRAALAEMSRGVTFFSGLIVTLSVFLL